MDIRECETTIYFLELFDPRNYYPFDNHAVATFIDESIKVYKESKYNGLKEWVEENIHFLKLKVCHKFVHELSCRTPEVHDQMLQDLKWKELFL